MIIVIADDFTGAAELAGVGLRFGLTVNLSTALDQPVQSELLVIDTDTRSGTEQSAIQKLQKVCAFIKSQSGQQKLFKKTDSVLRGHVALELSTLLHELNKSKVLLIPANPSMGRIIKKGTYYINDTPLHLTDFSNDPVFPRNASNLSALLGESSKVKMYSCDLRSPLPVGGIIAGDAESSENLIAWAKLITSSVIPAGGSDFFSAMLEVLGYKLKKNVTEKISSGNTKKLIICGSTSEQSRQFVSQCKEKGVVVCELPCNPERRENLTKHCKQTWNNNIQDAFILNRKVVVAINKPVAKLPGIGKILNNFIADSVEMVLQSVKIKEIFIEGGATASCILHKLEWSELIPVQEVAPGVVRMKVKKDLNIHITVKPGSYVWPKNLNFFDE